ncbi:MAG: VaFE repeat-containing surface-anchored protein, partial [Atopobiaceae bacterium]|nr:VaFE repeat-containing surface-anchored protein [Atopobiaceae bacterium]
TLTDTVWYENLVPGREYTVEGTLMDKATGEPLLDADGNPATASTTFTARTSSGTVEMEFTFKVNYVRHVSIVAFESLLEDGVEVAVHADIEDEDQTVHVPEIGTTATDSETGGHVALADESVTIVDAVEYHNMLPGQTYQLVGTLMDRETGGPVTDAGGNVVTATTELTPDVPDGEATVELTFDASQLAGHDVVVFERLYLGEDEVADHADIEDEGQTVTLPSIGTTATAGGSHEAAASESLTVTDVVAYEGLVPGEEHVVEGTLVDKATGEPIEGATASTTFTPEEESGTVEVTFTIDASRLSGHGLVAFERVSWQGHDVATHEDLSDEGQTVRIPSIGTTATDASDGDHVAQASARLRIADEVAYEGLTPGQEYVVTGTLMDRATGKAVDGATASATFTPKEDSGTVTVTFEVDGSGLAGHDLVAFEVLTRGDVTVATHEDLGDEGQTMRVVAIGTTATDKADGDHTIHADKAEIVDVIAYQGLNVGTEYTVSGTLMDRETGKPVTDGSGKPVTASTSFTPEKADGQVTVTFEVDASQLGGHDLVAFEVLAQGDVTVATHEDLEDEGQTVHVEEPKAPESPATPRLLPKTGDDTRLGPFVAAMAASGTGLVALGVSALRRRRREWDEEDPDDDYPHIRRGRVIQVMPDLGQEEVIP